MSPYKERTFSASSREMRQKPERDSKHEKESTCCSGSEMPGPTCKNQGEASGSYRWPPTESHQRNVTLVLKHEALDSANHRNELGRGIVPGASKKEHGPANTLKPCETLSRETGQAHADS